MPKRIQLSRTAGWRKPENATVVSRPSRWGNPFAIGRDAENAAHAVRLYKDWLETNHPDVLDPYGTAEYRKAMDGRRERILNDLPTLAGRDLACWCGPGSPCHADVLLAAVEELYGSGSP